MKDKEVMVTDLAALVDKLTSREMWSNLTKNERGMIRGAFLYGSRMVRLYNREEVEVKRKLQEG